MAIGAISGMQTGSLSGTGVGQTAGNTGDAFEKDIQKQINDLKKQLSEINQNKQLTDKEKQQKRKEISTAISDLNQQLHEHKQAKREEEARQEALQRQEAQEKVEKIEKNPQDASMSTNMMKALIAGEAAEDTAAVYDSVATKLEGKARTLKGEMKRDQELGGDTSGKAQEVAEAEATALKARGKQIKLLMM